MATEAAALRAAGAAGVAVPALVADATDGTALGMPAFVVERLPGETIARRLLRDDEYASVRPRVAGRCGEILAAIHRVDPSPIPGLVESDPLEGMRGMLDRLGQPHPALELGIRWLDRHRPEPSGTTLVHGDFRTGNLLISRDDVEAVLDWELCHLGDPLEDLGWFCARAWRFGNDDRPAGGFGSREELWAAYEAAGGRPVDPEAARWWEVYGNLRWGVITVTQASVHLLGISRSMELAAIGRRTAETEHDVLALVAPDAEAPPPTPVVEPTGAPHDRPTGHRGPSAVPRPGRGQRRGRPPARAGGRPVPRRGPPRPPRCPRPPRRRLAGRRHPRRRPRRPLRRGPRRRVVVGGRQARGEQPRLQPRETVSQQAARTVGYGLMALPRPPGWISKWRWGLPRALPVSPT
jgi:aminoglycoside phosphotransferase (APT) family kinase protein